MTSTEPVTELASVAVENVDGLRFDDVVRFVDQGLRQNMPGDTRVYGQGGVRAVRLEAEETP